MIRTLNVWLGVEIIYVYGTVNGVAATFTVGENGYWQAVVPRAENDIYEIYVEAYSAGGLEGSYTITVYYGFHSPKTDWKKTDYENASDWNRQTGNIKHIADEVLPALGYTAEQETIPTAHAETLPTAGLVNKLEGNLAAIADSGTPLPAGWELSKVWDSGKPDYTDANRWERNALLMQEQAQRIAKRWQASGTFSAGQTNILPRRI